ncbi:MAG: metallophosphoesterase [Proteobacteria bacterium]|nr:metallophosphoesterase [Pseudomonadota bacterium]
MSVDKGIFVIGDVHGCAHSLELLLEKIPSGSEVYTTGDLIDRGPHSRRVLSICIERGIRAVMGNHEHMLLDYLDAGGLYGNGVFIRNGGLETLSNYKGRIDAVHLEYIRSMPLYIETEHFILSHAGVGVMQTLESACRLEEDGDINILWNRGSLADVGKLQLIGHCPVKAPQEYYVKESLAGVNIDTGCVFPHFGTLTAMCIPDMSFIRVECKD